MSSSVIHRSWLALALALVSAPAPAGEFDVTVPMHDKGMATWYVHAEVADLGTSEFMVDTGAGYLTINEDTLNALQERRQAQYVKELRAVLANGSEMIIPVYTIDILRIGSCTIRDVEAAVFPARTRQILGLSALNKAAPFTFSIDPPSLVLRNCAERAETTPAQPRLVEARQTVVPAAESNTAPLRP